MPKLKISHARIRYADLRFDESGPFSRMHFSADVTKTVATKMGWEDFIYDGDSWRGGFGSVDLDGQLLATNFELRHQQSGASLELTADDVSAFSVHRKKEDDGEGTRLDLRFIVRSRQKGALAKVERYCELNMAGAQLLISHEKQQNLFDQNDEPEDEKIEPSAPLSVKETAEGALESARRGRKSGGATEQPSLSFAARMRAAASPDAGRTILRELETAIAALEREGGVKVPTVGDLPNSGYRGFSTVTPKEWVGVQKRIRDNDKGLIAAKLKDLVEDGKAANEEFGRLVAEENHRLFKEQADASENR
jgi:hypothetical protein